jgi:tetratricopeptide (TPR) repeat protein
MAQSAYREAVGYCEQALRVLPHLPETRDTYEQAIDLRLVLRSALTAIGDLGRILALLREAEALAVALDDPRRLGWVSHWLARQFYFGSAHDQAIAEFQRALALATAGGDAIQHALVHQELGTVYQAQGDYRRAVACYEQTLAFLAGARHRERFGQLVFPAVFSRAWLTSCHAELGMFAEGRSIGDEGLQIAEAVAHPPSLMVATWGLGLLALRQGDLRGALPRLERAVSLCQEADLPSVFPLVAVALGAAYTLAGRLADAVPLLTQALERSMAMEAGVAQALCRHSLGKAQLLAGRLDEAHALTERALALAREHQEQGNEAYALHLLGEIAMRHDPLDVVATATHYRQALALADALGMRPLAAHCYLGLGTLYGQTEQYEQARTALSTAIALYRDMAMTFWLPQTEAALAQVEGR